MRKSTKKLLVVILCMLFTIGFSMPLFAYNTVINTGNIVTQTITSFPYNTKITLGYSYADGGAKIVGFYNSTGYVVFSTGDGNKKSGTITIQVRENNANGPILYETTTVYTNASPDKLQKSLPSTIANFSGQDRVCITAIHTLQSWNGSSWSNMNFSFYNNQTGWSDWSFVNTDIIASDMFSLTQEARDSANIAADNTVYNSQSAAYWAHMAATAASADTSAPVIKRITGLNGATCTTSGTFYVAVSASDNSAGVLQAQASVDGGAYGALVTLPNPIPVTLSPGAHTITVQVIDEAGNKATETMIAFRL